MEEEITFFDIPDEYYYDMIVREGEGERTYFSSEFQAQSKR